MDRYVRIYRELLRLNLSSLVAYRSNFVNSVVSSTAWGVFSLVSIVLLTYRVQSVFGWTREEILLLTGVYSVVIGVFHTLFSRNFERFSRLVLYGTLDSVLVKPIDTQFLISFWLVNYAGLFRVVVGAAFIVYLLHALAIAVPASAVAVFSLFLIAGVLLLYSVWFLAATITIWYPRLTNIVDVMYTFSSISRFPREMYQQLSWYIFLFLLQLTFIIVTPVRVLVGKLTPADTIGLVSFAAILFFLSRKFWKFALRFYTSASS